MSVPFRPLASKVFADAGEHDATRHRFGEHAVDEGTVVRAELSQRRGNLVGNGKLGGGDIWAPVIGDGKGEPDGMKIDRDGNLYCCGPGGIHVFDPQAICLGVINVPEGTANFCFGDEDFQVAVQFFRREIGVIADIP